MPATATDSADGARQSLLLSVDFEDWQQLVRRRVGASNWEETGPSLRRQTGSLLSLLGELRLRATFFILGMAARGYPDLVEDIAAGGHEIACHGDAHLPVHQQTPAQFALDLRAAREVIEQLTGRSPVGYRAPAFSITRDDGWAYEVLASEGFGYDSSQHDSPTLRRRAVPAGGGPHPLDFPDGKQLWEFPIAVWSGRRARLPVGGASYWSVLPTQIVLRGLREAGSLAGLYLHPQEFDPESLRAALPRAASPAQRVHGTIRGVQRNIARRRAAGVLRAISKEYRLIPYGEAHAELSRSARASP